MRENPKGFFEDNGFVNINKEILRRSGGNWDAPPGEIKVDDALSARMKAFMDKWPVDEIVGLKDPRLCLTLGEWLKVTDDRVRFVYVLRDVAEIADSLHKRNGMDRDFAKELSRHYHESLAKIFTNGDWLEHTVITSYDRYFEDWESELERVCEFLEIKLPSDTSEIEAFIEPKLRHHKAA